MSSWGRCQNSLHDVLWGYEDGQGNFTPGLLHDLGWERVASLTEPILEAVYEIAYQQGKKAK